MIRSIYIKNTCLLICCALFFAIIIFISNANAGMCLMDTDEFLSEIKKLANSKKINSDRENLLYSLLCLYFEVEYLDMDYGKPLPIESLRSHSDEIKEKVREIVSPLMRHDSEEVKCSASAALAYYGWKESYDTLMSCNKIMPALQGYSAGKERQVRMKAIVLSIQGDERAIPWIIEQFKSVNKRYKKKYQFGSPAKLTFLNSLEAMGSKSIIPFLEGVVKNDRSAEVRARAQSILNKI